MSRKNIKDKVFGKLTALNFDYTDGKYSYWLCECECGNLTKVRISSLINGSTKSCGCIHIEQLIKRSTKHGYSKRGNTLRIYNIWCLMRRRCNNSTSKDFKYYGARSIKICNEWSNFEIFHTWALSNGYSENLTIDRINNNGNYEPNNCRWVSMEIQNKNKRKGD